MKGRRWPSGIAAVLFAAGFLAAEAGGGAGWRLDWSSIDSGGEIDAAGGNWRLSGTVGQWDATGEGALTGGEWELTGGFWQGRAPGAEVTDHIFGNRFEG